MKTKIIFGIVATLGIASIAIVMLFNNGFTLKETKKTQQVVPIHYEETIGNLSYEINLDKNQFDLNDEIVVNAKVTNLGNETLNYVSGSSSCPNHVIIDIVHKESNTRLAIKPNDQGCTADFNKSKLKPGQTVEDKEVFIQKQWIKSVHEPAPTGVYDVKVSLPPEDIKKTEDYQDVGINLRPGFKTSITLHDAMPRD